MHTRNSPFFFSTKTTGAAQAEVDSTVIPALPVLLIWTVDRGGI